jgi:glycosyltransferase involved in cell wall biosynthesis
METVSVIIPVYNRADRILRCLDSVFEQTYPQVEIIVVDDGSTDNLAERLEDIQAKIIYLHQANRGQGSARNAGIRAANGGWIAFLDSDDFWEAEKLEKQISGLRESGQLWGHTKTAMAPTDENPHYFGEWHQGPRSGMIASQLIRTNFICTSSVVINRRVIEEAGGFCEDRHIQNFEDYELWLRIAADYPIHYSDEVLTNYTADENTSARDESRVAQIEKNERVMQRIAGIEKQPYTIEEIRYRRIHYQQDHFRQALLEGNRQQAKVILRRLNAVEYRWWIRLQNSILAVCPVWLLKGIQRCYSQLFKRSGI